MTDEEIAEMRKKQNDSLGKMAISMMDRGGVAESEGVLKGTHGDTLNGCIPKNGEDDFNEF